MNIVSKFMPRPVEPLLTTEDLEDAARPKTIDNRCDLVRFGDTMDKLLDQRLKRRDWIEQQITDLEDRISDLQEQDRQNTVIIEMAERCVRESRDHAPDTPEPKLRGHAADIAMAEKIIAEDGTVLKDRNGPAAAPEQEPETA